MLYVYGHMTFVLRRKDNSVAPMPHQSGTVWWNTAKYETPSYL